MQRQILPIGTERASNERALSWREKRKSRPFMPSILARGLHLTGDIQSEGEVQIDGSFEGSIRCKLLAIGRTGQIAGDVAAEEVMVRGRIVGDILGNKVEIFQLGEVHGDILHNALVIHEGAGILGRTQYSDNPFQAAWSI